jgi:hypothetical protein
MNNLSYQNTTLYRHTVTYDVELRLQGASLKLICSLRFPVAFNDIIERRPADRPRRIKHRTTLRNVSQLNRRLLPIPPSPCAHGWFPTKERGYLLITSNDIVHLWLHFRYRAGSRSASDLNRGGISQACCEACYIKYSQLHALSVAGSNAYRLMAAM